MTSLHDTVSLILAMQRVVAEILIVLSVKEPGENWQVTADTPLHPIKWRL